MLMLMLMQVLHKDRLILLELPQLPTLLDQLNQLARLFHITFHKRC